MAQRGYTELLSPTGERVTLPDASVPAALGGGYVLADVLDTARYEQPPRTLELDAPAALPNRVEVITPTGNELTTTKANLGKLLQEGYRLKNESDERSYAEQLRYTSGIAPALAFAAGTARGLVLPGVSDTIIAALPGVTRADLRALKTHNEDLSVTGDIIGNVVGAIVTGGGKAVATGGVRGASKLLLSQGIVDLSSKAAERVAAKMITGKAAKYAVPLAKYAAEGMTIGAGEFVKEAALGEPNLTAQQFFSHVGVGGLLNLGLAGAFGGIAKGSGAVLKKFVGEGGVMKAADLIDAAGDEWAAGLVTGGRKSRDASRVEMGKLLREEKIITGGQFANMNGLAARLQTSLTKHKNQFDDVNAKLDKLLPLDREQFGTGEFILDKYIDETSKFVTGNEIASTLKKAVAGHVGGAADIVTTHADDVLAKHGRYPVSYAEANAIRREVQESVGAFERSLGRDLTAKEKKIAAAAESLNNLIEDKATSFIDELPEVKAILGGKSYRENRRDFGALINAQRALKTTMSPKGNNNTLDNMVRAGGALGALISGEPLIAAAAYVAPTIRKQLMRQAEFGLVGLANTAKQFSAIARDSNATKAYAKKAIKAFVDRSSLPSRLVVQHTTEMFDMSPDERAKAVGEQAYSLSEAVVNPEMYMQRIEDLLAPVAEIAPEFTRATTDMSLRALQYLHAAAPRDPDPGRMAMPDNRQWRPNDGQVTAYLRKAKAVSDPISVLDDLARGQLTSEAVDAIAAVYPQFYDWLQDLVLDQLHEKQMSYDQRLTLSRLFRLAIDPAMRPQSVMQQQALFVPTEQQQGGPPRSQFAPSRAGRLKLGGSAASEAQRLESR